MNSFEFVETETQTAVSGEGSQVVTFCHGLKLEITDGKRKNKNERIFLGKNYTGW